MQFLTIETICDWQFQFAAGKIQSSIHERISALKPKRRKWKNAEPNTRSHAVFWSRRRCRNEAFASSANQSGFKCSKSKCCTKSQPDGSTNTFCRSSSKSHKVKNTLTSYPCDICCKNSIFLQISYSHKWCQARIHTIDSSSTASCPTTATAAATAETLWASWYVKKLLARNDVRTSNVSRKTVIFFAALF